MNVPHDKESQQVVKEALMTAIQSDKCVIDYVAGDVSSKDKHYLTVKIIEDWNGGVEDINLEDVTDFDGAMELVK
jgi:hypothetical protein